MSPSQRLIILSIGSIVPTGMSRIFGSAQAVYRTYSDLAVGAEDPAVRRHLLDLGLAQPQVRDRPRRATASLDGRGGAGDHVAGEVGVEDLAIDPVLGEQPVGREVAVRGVVLVQGVDAHPLRGRAGRLGQRRAELRLAVVADPDPVHRAEHDRLAVADQDDAPATERVEDLLRRVVGHRAPDRRGGVDGEHPHFQFAVRPALRLQKGDG